jgi:para-nitrobenzyl esterase
MLTEEWDTNMRSEIRWGKAFAFALGLTATVNFASTPPMQVRTESGVVEGRVSADGKIRIFKGIPFAAPPTGDLRWQVPKPPLAWEGVRQTTDFGPHCMQGAIYKGMVFRDSGPSEDCLSLNVWTPADTARRMEFSARLLLSSSSG